MASQGDNSFAAVNGTANHHLHQHQQFKGSSASFKSSSLMGQASGDASTYASTALARAIGSGVPRPFYGATVRSESLPPPAAPPVATPVAAAAPPPAPRSPVLGTDYEQSEDEHNLRAQFKPIDSAYGYESSTDYGGSKRLLNFESTDEDVLGGDITDNEQARTRFRATIKDRESKGLAFKLPGLGAITFKSRLIIDLYILISFIQFN